MRRRKLRAMSQAAVSRVLRAGVGGVVAIRFGNVHCDVWRGLSVDSCDGIVFAGTVFGHVSGGECEGVWPVAMVTEAASPQRFVRLMVEDWNKRVSKIWWEGARTLAMNETVADASGLDWRNMLRRAGCTI